MSLNFNGQEIALFNIETKKAKNVFILITRREMSEKIIVVLILKVVNNLSIIFFFSYRITFWN